MKKIYKIVITGGPCAGKSSAMEKIQERFTKKGYRVFLISESATELIQGGISPWTCRSPFEYQMLQSRLQMEKESIFDWAAQRSEEDKILIVCDRGLMDGRAYVSAAEFKCILDYFAETEKDWLLRYDGVFFLETTAKGAEEHYTLCNNRARTETIEQAVRLDNQLISIWKDHPCFYQIDNSTGYEEKMNRLMTQIEMHLSKGE